MNSDQIPPVPALEISADESTCTDESPDDRPGGLRGMAADLLTGVLDRGGDRRERRQEREKAKEERKEERKERAGGGGGEQPKPAEIANVGPIAALRLPDGFRESKREAPDGGPIRIEFNNPKQDSMRLTFQTWDTHALSDNSSANFRRVLADRKDGPITDQAMIDDLAAIMPAGVFNYGGAMAETPQLRTATLNGRRVLVVEHQGHDDKALVKQGASDPNWRGAMVIIPSDNYRYQYTMSVEGSRNEFRRNFGDLERALNGTRWQKTPDSVLPPMPPPESKK